jgi:hypothetical protein
MYFNVIECMYQHYNWISPSLSHCNAFAMHTHLHIFFHSIQWLPSQHAIPLRSFFSIPVDPFQLSYNLSLLFASILPYNLSLFFASIHHPTFHISHSMSSLVARSIAEPKLVVNNDCIKNKSSQPKLLSFLGPYFINESILEEYWYFVLIIDRIIGVNVQH